MINISNFFHIINMKIFTKLIKRKVNEYSSIFIYKYIEIYDDIDQ